MHSRICVLSLVALAVAGCGGSGSENLTRDDVREILGEPPTKPVGSWKSTVARQVTFAELRGALETQGSRAALADALADAGFKSLYVRAWALSGDGDSTAQIGASLFRDAAGAHDGFSPLQKLTPSWFVPPAAVEDLGEEAVAAKGDAVAGDLWRRGNVVFGVYVTRGPGAEFDVVAAARSLAREIDERAKAQ